MFTSIKALFLTIILFFLNIPYGIDAPTRAFIQSSSLDQTPIVCEQTADGAEATFTLSMEQAYRAIKSDYPYYEVSVQLFDSLDGIDLSRSGKRYDNFQVIGFEEYTEKPYGAATTIEIKDDEGGKDAESDSFSVGKGKVLVVESSLEEGQAQIDFVEATVFSNEDDVPDDVILGDTAASITVGPGDSQTVSLEKGDYVMRVSTIGRTNGKIKVTEEKQ